MKNFVLAISGALLLSAGWLGISGLPLLIGFVSLLIVSAQCEKGRAGFRRMLGFTTMTLGLWSAITTWWIAMAGDGAWSGAVLSVAITVVLFGAVFMLFHYVSKRVPTPLAYMLLVTGWIAAEYLYTVGEVSFPWLVLGNGFAGDIKLVQWYDTTGVFGGSLWVWLCNILIYRAIVSRTGRTWIAPAVAVLIPVAISLVIYWTYREPTDTIKVTAVQPNFHPEEKFMFIDEENQIKIMLHLAAKAPDDVDYIIFPETAVDIDMSLDERRLERSTTIGAFRQLLKDSYPTAKIILGATTTRLYMPSEKPSLTARRAEGFYYDRYNSAIRIDTSMNTPVHHKSKLLIGVEKMPYSGRYKWLDNMILDMGGTTGNLGLDSVRRIFPDPVGHTVAAAVCWEGVFGGYMTEFVRGGANAMFIISNDSWWQDTQGYRELFRFSRLRAVEMRRAIARSANTGISGFIDQRGNVLDKSGWDERTAITDEIALGNRITFYVRYGDYMARISTLAFGLCLLCCIAFIFRKKLQK
jgi:apolipoprotein N-acyltransferase